MGTYVGTAAGGAGTYAGTVAVAYAAGGGVAYAGGGAGVYASGGAGMYTVPVLVVPPPFALPTLQLSVTVLLLRCCGDPWSLL